MDFTSLKARLTQPTTIIGLGVLAATWGIGLENIEDAIKAALPFLDRIDKIIATALAVAAIVYNEKPPEPVEAPKV